MEPSQPPSEKAKEFPTTPGVYLMKDASGVVLYIGKAKNLRNRVTHYFTKAAAEDPRTANLVPLIADIDFLAAESEVDALFLEARLIKDVQPKFNRDLRDGKTFPYLQIRTREEFPRVEVTRTPRRKGVRLYGPFLNATTLRRALLVLQKVFQFRTCQLDIRSQEERWRWFRPCLLHSIRQCTGPCNFRVTREDYRASIKSLILILEGKKKRLLSRMRKEMQKASGQLLFEKAARLRDEIIALEKLDERGSLDRQVQYEVFPINPKKGMKTLKRDLGLPSPPRIIDGFDIAHLGGEETVASQVRFLDGLPFKPGYRRFRIRTVEGVDDFASMREVITRRYRQTGEGEEFFPDLILIDGGKGQLNGAMDAFRLLGVTPPAVISLAKREEEIFRPGESAPLLLSRHSAGLRLLQYVRDEAHRFAQHYHHLLRRKKLEGEMEQARDQGKEIAEDADPTDK
ncbi:MAG: excinuclease ABC subunit UvrC [Gemmataceae bacterium]|nr:excinuclease ABC subunit UvrC [Gemmataceae bacterium]